MRISIGCVKLNFMPGMSCSVSSIFSMSSALVEAFFHCERGVRGKKISCWDKSMGSVAMSGRPMRVAVVLISLGKRSIKTFSTRVARSIALSTEMPGK